MGNKQARIVVVDDHPMFREGLVTRIRREPGFRVVAEAGDATTALRRIRDGGVDVVCTDVTLRASSGLQLVSDVRTACPDVASLVLTVHHEDVYGERAVRAGACGYVRKDQPWMEIREALTVVADGGVAFGPELTQAMLRLLGRSAGLVCPAHPVDALSDRELEVFELIGDGGRRVRDVAGALHISPKTVETHIASIKRKLSIRHANELVHRATVWWLTRPVGSHRSA